MSSPHPVTDDWVPVTAADVTQFLAWRYDGADAVYDLDPADADWFLDPSLHCHVLRRDGRVEAFCTFGEDARVPGGDYAADALDVGIGTDPAIVGGGGGAARTASLLRLADALFGPGPRRVTIAAWNERAQRVARANGFGEVSRFVRGDGTEFVVLVRP